MSTALDTIAASLMILGGVVALLAAIGLLRFETAYARFHSAGKASPVAFLIASLGAAVSLGLSGAAQLAVAATAMTLTLPVGVHLLFRAVHRSTASNLEIDELAVANGG